MRVQRIFTPFICVRATLCVVFRHGQGPGGYDTIHDTKSPLARSEPSRVPEACLGFLRHLFASTR